MMGNTNNLQWKGYLGAFLAALTYGSYGIWAKLAGESIGPYATTFYRSWPIIFFVILIGLYKNSLRKVDREDYKWILLYILGGQIATFPFNVAVIVEGMSVGEVLFLFYGSFVISTYVLAWGFYREALNKYKAIGLILSLLGLGLMYKFEIDLEKVLGIGLSILAGFGFAILSVSTRKFSRKYSSELINLWGYLPYLVTAPIFMALAGESLVPKLDGAVWTLGYALASLFAGYLVIMAFKYIEAQKAGLILLLEPVVTTVLALVIFAEDLPSGFIPGAFLIMIAAALPNLQNFSTRKIQ